MRSPSLRSSPALVSSLTMRHLALLLLYGISRTLAQPCITSVPLEDYQRCLDENDCPCCDYDPTDKDPIIPIEEPSSCRDIYQAVCPLIHCCDACLPSNREFYQCAATGLALFFLQSECPIDESTCAGLFEPPSCRDEPTMAPVTKTPCESAEDSYQICLAQNCPVNCNGCDCCCPPCQEEREEMVNCQACSTGDPCTEVPTGAPFAVVRTISQSSATLKTQKTLGIWVTAALLAIRA